MQKLSCVLLVDDEETTNFLHAHLLKNLGVTDQVLVAHNGQEALSLLAHNCSSAATCPMLVFLDIHMPVMGGIDFLAAYQPQPPAQAIQVVVLTSSVHLRDLERLKNLPHLAVLQKPLTRAKVDALLQEHFQRKLADC